MSIKLYGKDLEVEFSIAWYLARCASLRKYLQMQIVSREAHDRRCREGHLESSLVLHSVISCEHITREVRLLNLEVLTATKSSILDLSVGK